MDFRVQADHWVEIKECETLDKYLDLAWELKKLWTMKMKVTLIPIVIRALGTILNSLEKKLEEQKIREKIETS